MIQILGAIFVLGVLIIFHELGHYLAAVGAGVKVEKFSIGFGPTLFTWRTKNTEFSVSLILFGGYVKLAGESPHESTGKENEFISKSPWKRMVIVASGPFMSFFLAFLIFFLIYLTGYPVLTNKIGEVKEGYPAEEAGLRKGDRIVNIEGKPVETWEEMAEIIHKKAQVPLTLMVERGKQRFTVRVTPVKEKIVNIWKEKQEVGIIGVSPFPEFVRRRETLGKAIFLGAKKVGEFTHLFFKAFSKIITGKISPRELGGPLLIIQLAGKEAKQGFQPLLILTGFISVNLGLINLFPFPALDGGYLLFFFIEGIRRRPISPQKQELVQRIGMAILIALMILITFNDIANWKKRNAYFQNEEEKRIENRETLPGRE